MPLTFPDTVKIQEPPFILPHLPPPAAMPHFSLHNGNVQSPSPSCDLILDQAFRRISVPPPSTPGPGGPSFYSRCRRIEGVERTPTSRAPIPCWKRTPFLFDQSAQVLNRSVLSHFLSPPPLFLLLIIGHLFPISP